MHFNLITEPWIPVLKSDGSRNKIGIHEALVRAQTVFRLTPPSPLDQFSVIRLLLAVLIWCKPSLTRVERDRLVDSRNIPDNWLRKKLWIDENPNPAFDLLDGTQPFYQHADLDVDKPNAATNLFIELPTATNIAHFRHLQDFREGLCLSCCAMGMIRWSCFAAYSTKGKKARMPHSLFGDTPAYAIPIGPNLFETLFSAFDRYQPLEGDRPIWDGAYEQSPHGLLKLLTWQTRRVLLATGSGGRNQFTSGFCCECGEHTDRLVRSISFQPGWESLPVEPWAVDPHILYFTKMSGTEGKITRWCPKWPGSNDPSERFAASWRTTVKALFARGVNNERDHNYFITLLLGANQALYKHAEVSTIELPRLSTAAIRILSDEMSFLEETINKVRNAVGRTARAKLKGNEFNTRLPLMSFCPSSAHKNLTSLSALLEDGCKTAYFSLARELSILEKNDEESCVALALQWRSRLRNIVESVVVRALRASTPGSPLIRKTTEMRARNALSRIFAADQIPSRQKPDTEVGEDKNGGDQ